MLENELKILKHINHENIIEFEKQFEDKDNSYILTKLYKNKTLKELLNYPETLTELEVYYYSIQIINALKYLHIRNIIHRNLNLKNIFISDKM